MDIILRAMGNLAGDFKKGSEMVRFAIEREIPQAAGRQNSLERKGVEWGKTLGEWGAEGLQTNEVAVEVGA